ncbi:unnamed protein product, partial [Musa hybrid cultivar]
QYLQDEDGNCRIGQGLEGTLDSAVSNYMQLLLIPKQASHKDGVACLQIFDWKHKNQANNVNHITCDRGGSITAALKT